MTSRLFLSLLLGLGLAHANGCAALMHAPAEPPRATPAPVEPDKSFLLVPYGTYRGTGRDLSAELTLRDNHSFVLSWTHAITGEQGQWDGRFEWKKAGIGEVLHLMGVREAINARRGPMTRDERLAVMGIDAEHATFSVAIGQLGTLEFSPRTR